MVTYLVYIISYASGPSDIFQSLFHYFFVGGVSGTPTFMVNDVLVDADPSWTVNDWKKLIDPLLQGSSSVRKLGNDDDESIKVNIYT